MQGMLFTNELEEPNSINPKSDGKPPPSRCNKCLSPLDLPHISPHCENSKDLVAKDSKAALHFAANVIVLKPASPQGAVHLVRATGRLQPLPLTPCKNIN